MPPVPIRRWISKRSDTTNPTDMGCIVPRLQTFLRLRASVSGMRLSLVFLLGLAACGGGKTPPTVPPTASDAGPTVGGELGPPPGDDLGTGSAADGGAAPTPAGTGTVASQFSDTKAAPDQEDCSKSAIPYEEKVR